MLDLLCLQNIELIWTAVSNRLSMHATCNLTHDHHSIETPAPHLGMHAIPGNFTAALWPTVLPAITKYVQGDLQSISMSPGRNPPDTCELRYACRWCGPNPLSCRLDCLFGCRGVRAYERNEYAEAVRLWSTALDLNESNAAVILCNRSSAYAHLGCWADAVNDARQVMNTGFMCVMFRT